MRIKSIATLCFALLCIFTSCEENKNFFYIPIEELPAEEFPVEEFSVSVEELPAEEFPAEEFPVEEFSVEETHLFYFHNLERLEEWRNENHDGRNNAISHIDDYTVGDFYIGMILNDTYQFFPSGSYVLTEDDDVYPLKTFDFESLCLWFHQIPENDELFRLFTFETSESTYATARGLNVGDSVDRLLELYGIPCWINNGRWYYCDDLVQCGYIRFSATVEEGVVTSYYISQML
jgi:hypothetical protein